MSHFMHRPLPLLPGRAAVWAQLGVISGALCLGVGGRPPAAIAHGVVMDYQIKPQVEIRATYDSGEPFAQAQVSIYPPNSDTPSQTGQTTNQGQFTFTPDPAQPGTWQVKVRAGGHGDMVSIPLAANSPAAATATPQNLASVGGHSAYTPLQKGVMVGAIAWGCVGTALFCLRRKD